VLVHAGRRTGQPQEKAELDPREAVPAPRTPNSTPTSRTSTQAWNFAAFFRADAFCCTYRIEYVPSWPSSHASAVPAARLPRRGSEPKAEADSLRQRRRAHRQREGPSEGAFLSLSLGVGKGRSPGGCAGAIFALPLSGLPVGSLRQEPVSARSGAYWKSTGPMFVLP
jgi:hypothetical protein